ncbi:unnamed protein product [Spirodela intermedia]|uniref:Uncharacterized protein n=1 Tax=Spirodela intermedia TaxID=51605 RepID=A0A7I8KAR1_SPIIN|nr:unnamed protein product [Spirodela intermedia]
MFSPPLSPRNPQLLASSWPSSPAVPSLSSLLSSVRKLAGDGEISAAFLVYSSLRRLSPAAIVFLHPISSLLATSTKLRAVPQGLQLHAHLISLGFHRRQPLVSRLVAFYAGCGELDEAQAMAESSTSMDCLPWNILISGHVRAGFPLRALLLYRAAAEKGVAIDGFTCSSVLKACGDTLGLRHARMLQARMEKTGLDAGDLFLRNALVSVYAKCGDIAAAEKLFGGMPERDVVSWNAMISGFVSMGMWEDARRFLEKMRGEVALNTVTWNTIIGGNLQMGNHGGALQLISQMKKMGSPPDAVTIVIALITCSKLGCLKLGKEIHGSAVRSIFDHQEPVTNSLITMYSRCDRIRSAEILFKNSNNRSSVAWSCIIAGNARTDRPGEASSLFRAMARSAGGPTQAAIMALLPLYGRIGDIRHGRELHCYITKQASCSCLPLWNALLFMYCKSGRVSEAWKLFQSMESKDEVSYTSMISGFGRQGEGLRALALFKAMARRGLTPDHVAISAALSACCRVGLLTEGQWIFDNMTRLYSVVPRQEHYSSMINLYVRSGFLGPPCRQPG